MQWSPAPVDHKMSNFSNPPHLNSFLSTLLDGNENAPSSSRVARLKSSFGQDLAYAGRYIVQPVGNIISHTPDTDFFFIALSFSSLISENILIRSWTQNKTRATCLPKVWKALKIKYDLQDIDLASKALLGLHRFTSCDTVSAFSGKGKLKPLDLMLKSSHYIDLFASISEEPGLSADLFQIVQQLVFKLYGYKEKNNDIVRSKLNAAEQG